LKVATDIAGIVDDFEIRLSQHELDLDNFEIVVINEKQSFSIQLILKTLRQAGIQIKVIEPKDAFNPSLFSRYNSIKCVIGDGAMLRKSVKLLNHLKNLKDEGEHHESSLLQVPLVMVTRDSTMSQS